MQTLRAPCASGGDGELCYLELAYTRTQTHAPYEVYDRRIHRGPAHNPYVTGVCAYAQRETPEGDVSVQARASPPRLIKSKPT
ncbi:unnamed protein product [Rangifer tarandus platyrhynchus]|uniref:Uncharacterized protein n=1 Tax=Rangifer tarandus platyrhynchus TaxID=3082113 RepID=A0ABN8XK40_RANTA|nr:unnamed protein product [Rangifer tarandus platyrhynchus]